MGRIPVWKMETLFCRRTEVPEQGFAQRDRCSAVHIVWWRNVLITKELVRPRYDREEEYALVFQNT